MKLCKPYRVAQTEEVMTLFLSFTELTKLFITVETFCNFFLKYRCFSAIFSAHSRRNYKF